MARLPVRHVIRIACIVTGVGGLLLAQEEARPPADSAAPDALLAEVRALRAEISQLASASIRAQLFTARLQLQEQRVTSTATQLVEAQGELAAVGVRIAGERARIRQLQDAALRTTGQGRAAIQQAILDANTQIEQEQHRELQLRATENERLKAMDEATIRWREFNSSLDALERALPSSLAR